MKLTFPTDTDAETALRSAGFSISTTQRNDPRGLMFGDVEIGKWRNLTYRERNQCHATFMRHGPIGSSVTVTLNDHCPADGKAAL